MNLIPELGSRLGSICRLETGYSVTVEQHGKVTKRMAQRRQAHFSRRSSSTKSESAGQAARS